MLVYEPIRKRRIHHSHFLDVVLDNDVAIRRNKVYRPHGARYLPCCFRKDACFWLVRNSSKSISNRGDYFF